MVRLLIIGFLLAFASAAEYAVLVAGSNGYWNYRHQADICHAYHTLRSHGIPAQNIIVLSYDDVANSSENPFRGTLYNQPGNDAIDYNAGCVKDYTGTAVTPDNFLAVITGNKAGVKGGNGRVLESGPDDHVFINFADHGAPGLIAFPTKYLYANDLIQALQTMHSKNMYKQLVFYLEACESGSMFEGKLPANINVYAVTAANTSESSWGTYCPPNDIVHGKATNTCLGDLFSVNWMQDSDAANVSSETLQTQYNSVKTETSKSHVMQYGDLNITSENIGQFEGDQQSAYKATFTKAWPHWDSRDVKLQYLSTKYQRDPSWESAEELMEEIVEREYTREVFEAFAEMVSPYPEHLLKAQYPPSDFECLKAAMGHHESFCGRLSDFGLKFVRVLVNACESGVPIEDIRQTLAEACAYNDYPADWSDEWTDDWTDDEWMPPTDLPDFPPPNDFPEMPPREHGRPNDGPYNEGIPRDGPNRGEGHRNGEGRHHEGRTRGQGRRGDRFDNLRDMINQIYANDPTMEGPLEDAQDFVDEVSENIDEINDDQADEIGDQIDELVDAIAGNVDENEINDMINDIANAVNDLFNPQPQLANTLD